jgi:hypothetical protein
MQMALRALKNAYSFIPMKMMERHLQAENALRDRLAKPEWVGLTDEEIAEIPFLELVEGIQAKLKEKNS